MSKAGKVTFKQLMEYKKDGRLKWVGSQILQREKRGDVCFMIYILEQIKPRQHKKFIIMRSQEGSIEQSTFWVSEAHIPAQSDAYELEQLHASL